MRIQETCHRPDMIQSHRFTLACLLVAMGHGALARAEEFVLVAAGQACQVRAPASETSGGGWNQSTPPTDPDAWTAGQTGVGFDNGTTFLPHINLDVEQLMRAVNGSIYVRIPF
jgi:hypothetical protein